MTNTPLEERPRERLLKDGYSTLSLRECIAVLLGSGPKGLGCMGLAQNILERPGFGLNPNEQEMAFFTALEVSGQAHLANMKGLGEAGQARLLAAFALARRYHQLMNQRHPEQDRIVITTAWQKEVIKKIPPHRKNATQEWLGFIPFHRNGTYGEFCTVELGVRTHVNIDPAELFARILALRPKGFVLFHNHPSGSLIPSEEDKQLTHRVQTLAMEFGIKLLGHAIITPQQDRWIVI
mgnify:CR=1 FL=1